MVGLEISQEQTEAILGCSRWLGRASRWREGTRVRWQRVAASYVPELTQITCHIVHSLRQGGKTGIRSHSRPLVTTLSKESLGITHCDNIE